MVFHATRTSHVHTCAITQHGEYASGSRWKEWDFRCIEKRNPSASTIGLKNSERTKRSLFNWLELTLFWPDEVSKLESLETKLITSSLYAEENAFPLFWGDTILWGITRAYPLQG